MKTLNDVLYNLSKIKPDSDARLYEISGKAIFFILTIEITIYWAKEKVGIPIPYDVFSIETLNFLISQYQIIILISIFTLVLLTINGAISVLNWLLVFIVRAYTLGNPTNNPFYIFYKKTKKVALLKSYRDRLKNDLLRQIEINESGFIVASFLLKLSMYLMIFYSLIIKSKFDIFYSNEVAWVGWIICVILLFVKSGGTFYRTKKEHLEVFISVVDQQLKKYQ